MAELVVSIPKGLEEEIRDLPREDWQKVALEAIRARAFKLKLERSNRLKLLLLKMITSKSGLSEEEADEFAIEVGNEIKRERVKELQFKGLL